MDRKPRDKNEKILTPRTLAKSLLQGFAIFAASFITYYVMLLKNTDNASIARSMGLAIIIISNLLLVQVNSSDYDFAIQSFKRLIKDKVMWVVDIVSISGLLIILYSPLNQFLKLAPLTWIQFLSVVGIAAVAVMWYEVVKLVNKLKHPRKQINK